MGEFYCRAVLLLPSLRDPPRHVPIPRDVDRPGCWWWGLPAIKTSSTDLGPLSAPPIPDVAGEILNCDAWGAP